MTILTKISNKSGLLVTIIAVALGVFILQSALESRNSFFADERTKVAEINGNEVSYEAFEAKIAQAEENEKTRTGGKLDDNMRENIRQQVWNQFLLDNIMKPRYDKLGIGVSPKELFDMVQGPDPHQSVKQAFSDPNTNQFDPKQVITFLTNMDKDETGDTKNRWMLFEVAIKDEKVASKYTTMVKKGLYITKAEAKRDYTFKNEGFSFRFIADRYVSIPDSTIKVTDADLQKYYSEHKYKYTQQTTTRGIEYVEFEVLPNQDDKDKALTGINRLKDEFAAAPVDSDYVNINSDQRFVDKFLPRAALSPIMDTLFNAPLATVIGPYMEGNSYKISKLTGIKMMPDSVKARHILIKPINGDIAKAKAKADSLKNLVKAGQKFDVLAQTNSEDPGSAIKGGDLGWFKEGMMVKPFNDACFYGKVGELVTVESQFGVHLIELMAKGPEAKRIQVGTVQRNINPSSATYQSFFTKASEFAGKNNTKELFEKAIKEGKFNKQSAMFLRDLDRTVNGMENSRELVRWAYNAEKGDVSKVFELGSKYVVAILVSIKEKGTLPLDEVKEQVEIEAKKVKKAEQMMAKLEAGMKGCTMLDQVADKTKLVVEPANGQNFGNPSLPSAGREPQLYGRITSLKKGALYGPFKGENGVYVVQLDEKVPAPEIKELKPIVDQLTPSLAGRVDYAMFEALKEKSDIKDNRINFY